MENNEQNKEKLLDYLELIRDNQALKSPDEINRELLDGTVSMLLKLQNKKIDLSIEEVKERVRKIPFVKMPDFDGASQNRRKKINKRKILLIAAIIAILCTLLTIISNGYDFDDIHRIMREKFGSVFNVPIGEEQINGNNEFVFSGKSVVYSSEHAFFKKEDYNILVPSSLPEKTKLQSISLTKKTNEIIFSYDNSCLTGYKITMDSSVPQIVVDNSDNIKKINELKCYIDYMEDINLIQIYFEHNGNCYKIGGTDEQILLNIIENLEEKQ